jgi:hypothetical protein
LTGNIWNWVEPDCSGFVRRHYRNSGQAAFDSHMNEHRLRSCGRHIFGMVVILPVVPYALGSPVDRTG